MSLHALGNDLFHPRQKNPKVVLTRIADPSSQFETFESGEDSGPDDPSGTNLALDAISKFIPTEMLAPYVTALSLAVTQGWNEKTIYVAFIVATPLVFVLFSFAKQALDRKPWPAVAPLVWRAFAAMIAFAVWGLSVPTNPLQAAIGGAAVAGFLALIVSPVLSAVDAIALRVLGVTSAS